MLITQPTIRPLSEIVSLYFFKMTGFRHSAGVIATCRRLPTLSPLEAPGVRFMGSPLKEPNPAPFRFYLSALRANSAALFRPKGRSGPC